MKFEEVRLLPMPLSRIRRKLINKTYSNERVGGRYLYEPRTWHHTWLGNGFSLSLNLAILI